MAIIGIGNPLPYTVNDNRFISMNNQLVYLTNTFWLYLFVLSIVITHQHILKADFDS